MAVESIEDIVGCCSLISEQIDELDRRGPLTPADKVTAWHHLHAVLDSAKVVLGQMASDAVEAMVELGAREWVTPVGVVHVQKGSVTEHWRGHELAARLAVKAVDTSSGEVIEAVPLDRVRAVVPGCAKDDLTSSKWATGQLGQWVEGWERYRTRFDAPTVIKPGPLPEVLRPKRRNRKRITNESAS